MAVDSVRNLFFNLLKEFPVSLTEEQWNQFEVYYKTLVEWNAKMNLTGIVEREQVYIKHFYDSLSLSRFFPLHSVHTFADIGAGAGFPSIPLKIVFPHLKVTIIDSLNKRIQFLEHVTETLHLSEVRCVHGRAEDCARQKELRDSFDLVTARAVARLNILNELCLPFVVAGGHFIALKGPEAEEEISEASFSIKQLNGDLQKVFSFQLPVEHASRTIVVIKKTKPTPAKYPRKAGTPSKNPLVGS